MFPLEMSSQLKKYLYILFFGVVMFFLYISRQVLAPFLISFIIAYLLNPIVEMMTKRKLNRVFSVISVTCFVILIVSFVVVPVVLKVAAEMVTFSDRIAHIDYSSFYQKSIVKIQTYLKEYPSAESIRNYFNDSSQVQEMAGKLIGQVNGYLAKYSKFLGFLIIGFFNRILDLVLIGVITFYILVDFSRVRPFIIKQLPADIQNEVDSLLIQLDEILGSYIRGQLVIAMFVGFLITLALILLGVDFALIIGFLSGLANIIPYMGIFVGIIPSIIIILIKIGFSVQAGILCLKVVGAIGLIQMIDGMFLSPRIIGKNLNLHPLIIMFSLFIGGNLFGIYGMVIAVPTAAVIKILINRYYIHFDKL